MIAPLPHPHRGDAGRLLPAIAAAPGASPGRVARPGGSAARIPTQAETARRLHCLAARQPGALDRRAAARLAEIGRHVPALTPEARAVIDRARLDARNWKDLP